MMNRKLWMDLMLSIQVPSSFTCGFEFPTYLYKQQNNILLFNEHVKWGKEAFSYFYSSEDWLPILRFHLFLLQFVVGFIANWLDEMNEWNGAIVWRNKLYYL